MFVTLKDVRFKEFSSIRPVHSTSAHIC